MWYCIKHYGDDTRHKSEGKTQNDTPYLALTGELRGVYCEYVGEMDCVMTVPHCIVVDELLGVCCDYFWPCLYLTRTVRGVPEVVLIEKRSVASTW